MRLSVKPITKEEYNLHARNNHERKFKNWKKLEDSNQITFLELTRPVRILTPDEFADLCLRSERDLESIQLSYLQPEIGLDVLRSNRGNKELYKRLFTEGQNNNYLKVRYKAGFVRELKRGDSFKFRRDQQGVCLSKFLIHPENIDLYNIVSPGHCLQPARLQGIYPLHYIASAHQK